jgi:D-alanyl-D-alanine carboxypeptidase
VQLALGKGAQNGLETALISQIQPILDTQAAKFNISFSFGFKHAQADVAIASGFSDYKNGVKATPSSLYPAGSVTKTFTSVAILKLVQRGTIGLDDPVHQYVDPYLQRTNGTTLLKLWGGNETIQTVTIRQLLGMRSGVNDYDNVYFRNVTITRPDYDYSPIDLLHDLNKTFAFAPGTQGEYSSMNFELLGLVLVHCSNSSHWSTYDIKSSIMGPPDSPLSHDCKDMIFMGAGRCVGSG